MYGPTLYRTLRQIITALAVAATAAALVFAIYFTRFDLERAALLTGILLAGILAMVARTSITELSAARRSEELVVVQHELVRVTREHKSLSEAYTAAKERLEYADAALPAMLLYADTDRRCQYYNPAFDAFVGLPPKMVAGRHLRDILGPMFYAEIESAVDEVLAGHTSYCERTRRISGGRTDHMLTLLLPRRASDGSVAGFYAVLTDITARGHLLSGVPERGVPPAAADEGSAQDMFGDALAEQITGWTDAAQRIVVAIEKDEFTLYCQLIRPLALDSGQPVHYEILVRLLEEEQNLLPPGAFFPLAEKHGLMPHLDRWVLAHVLEWVAAREAAAPGGACGKYFINIAGATISDHGYPEFVRQQLEKFTVPGSAICFELTVSDVTSRRGEAAEFARLLKQCGCQIALSDYGGDFLSLDILKHVPADFLKINGSIILNILRDPVHLAKVVAIGRMAKSLGIRTVGELVEDDKTMEKLRQAGIDFAQGYGISRPQPLADVARMTA